MTGLIYNSNPKLPLDSAGLSMSKKLFHCSLFDPTNSSWSKMRNLPQWLMQSIQMLCQAFRDILGITTSRRASTAKHKCYKKLVYSIHNTVNMSFKTYKSQLSPKGKTYIICFAGTSDASPSKSW